MKNRNIWQSGFFEFRLSLALLLFSAGVLLALLGLALYPATTVFAQAPQQDPLKGSAQGNVMVLEGRLTQEPAGAPTVSMQPLVESGVVDMGALDIHPLPASLVSQTPDPGPSGGAVATGNAFLSISPEIGSINTTRAFVIVGANFTPGENVFLFLNGAVITAFQADAAGRVNIGLSTGGNSALSGSGSPEPERKLAEWSPWLMSGPTCPVSPWDRMPSARRAPSILLVGAIRRARQLPSAGMEYPWGYLLPQASTEDSRPLSPSRPRRTARRFTASTAVLPAAWSDRASRSETTPDHHQAETRMLPELSSIARCSIRPWAGPSRSLARAFRLAKPLPSPVALPQLYRPTLTTLSLSSLTFPRARGLRPAR